VTNIVYLTTVTTSRTMHWAYTIQDDKIQTVKIIVLPICRINFNTDGTNE
jgi:hypothetical protein